jgi:hypothetical protein
MEATSGFEPLNKGFADLPLSHLGTSPLALTPTLSQRERVNKETNAVFHGLI